MKFLADECCDANLVAKLRREGHDVLYIMTDRPGATDTEVLEKAFLEKRVLITEDKDFGELVYRLKKPGHGVVLLRFPASAHKRKWLRLKELINRRRSTLLGYFVVVDDEKFRIRPL